MNLTESDHGEHDRKPALLQLEQTDKLIPLETRPPTPDPRTNELNPKPETFTPRPSPLTRESQAIGFAV